MPIARYKCQQKGQNKTGHRTFSLLPHVLVPCYQHDLNLIADTIAHHNQQRRPTLEETKNFISAKGQHTDIPLENNHIHRFQKLLQQAYYKLITSPQFNQYISRPNQTNDPVKNMLHIIDQYQTPFQTTTAMNASNIQKLAWDFCFNFQTDSFVNRHFLVGTPSQKQ